MSCKGKLQTILTLSVTLLLVGSSLVFVAPNAKALVTKIIWSTNTFLSGEIKVNADQELIIMPDITVTLATNTNLTILGNLTAIGTPAQPINFLPEVSGVPWGMLNLSASARGSHLAYCLIEQATTGIYAYQTDLYVDHSNISSNILDGIHAYDSTVHITNSTFRGNGAGQPLVQAGIYLNHATGLVDNNNLTNNNHGIYLKEASTVTVSNNIILGSTCTQCAGIKVRSGSNPVIDHNIIRGNYAGIISNDSSSMIKNNNISSNLDDGILLVNLDSSTVQDNLVSHNGDDGLEANSGSTPYMVRNDISYNSDTGVNVLNATVNMSRAKVHENANGLSVYYNGRFSSYYNSYDNNSQYGILVYYGSNLTSVKDQIDGSGNMGLQVFNSTAFLKGLAIFNNKLNIQPDTQSEIFIEDGFSRNASEWEVAITSGHLTLLNFTRVNQTVKWMGNDARLIVKWNLAINVTDQFGAPLPGANVTITPFGFPTYNETTNSKGTTGPLAFTEFNKTYNWGVVTEQYWSPYHIVTSYKGSTNSTDINLTSSRNITLKLLVVNDPPVLAVPFGDYSFNEDTTAYGLVNCSEHFTDEGPLNYSLVMQSDPTKVLGKVNGTKLDFYTPTKDWNGVQKFQVRANDSKGLITLSNIFNVTVLPVNDRPVLLPQPDLFSGVNETVSGTLKATDVDTPPSNLVFHCLDVPPGGIVLTLDQHSGVFTFKSNSIGYSVYHFVVSDGVSQSNTITVNFTVTNMNTPPSFTSKDIVTVYLGEAYHYLVTAYDPDGDPMTLTLVDWPHGMTLSGWNLTWSPDSSQLGQKQVGLSLSDGKNPPVLHHFNITVYAENHPPVPKILTPSTGTNFYVGSSIHFKGNVTDPDKDNLTYTWRIDGTVVSTLIEFNTTLTAGTHKLSFAASDGKVTAYDNTTILVKIKVTNKPYKTYLDNMCLILEVTVVTVCVVSVIVYRRFKH